MGCSIFFIIKTIKMYYLFELVLKSYKPLHLEKGMLFVQKLHQGTHKEEVNVFALDKVPQDEDEFISKHGYPVQPYIVDEFGEIVVYPEQIGWWDEGEESEDYYDITLKEINTICNEFDGEIFVNGEWVEFQIDEEIEELVQDVFVPVILENKAIMCYPFEQEEDDDDWEDDDDDNEQREDDDDDPFFDDMDDDTWKE